MIFLGVFFYHVIHLQSNKSASKSFVNYIFARATIKDNFYGVVKNFHSWDALKNKGGHPMTWKETREGVKITLHFPFCIIFILVGLGFVLLKLTDVKRTRYCFLLALSIGPALTQKYKLRMPRQWTVHSLYKHINLQCKNQ